VIRVNLLPHREEKRRARRQQFYALLGLAVVVAGAIWFVVFGVINGLISSQDDKNAFLKKEIASLDREIEEIKRLREQTDSLLSRKNVIESLQANRTETVHLFNELVRQVPDGIYLKAMRQTGLKINLTGYAQSNARVSTLMRNLGASPLLERPDLIQINSTTVNNRRVSEFNLDVYIARKTADSGKPAGAAGVQAAGALKDKKP
jgi:type IV pilus assembly protein PilN